MVRKTLTFAMLHDKTSVWAEQNKLKMLCHCIASIRCVLYIVLIDLFLNGTHGWLKRISIFC